MPPSSLVTVGDNGLMLGLKGFDLSGSTLPCVDVASEHLTGLVGVKSKEDPEAAGIGVTVI